jgi:ribonuclease-3
MAGLGMRAEHPTRSAERPRVDIRRLQATLSTTIHQPRYFDEALTHRSYLQMPHMQGGTSNERLEFLGDAVLSLIVGEYLFHRYGEAPEGELTKIRSRLVNRKALSIMASTLSLGEFMFLSPAAMQLGDKGMDTILSDAFEAIIGAIYLDGGYADAKEFVNRCIENALAHRQLSLGDDNFKSQLLEYMQSLGLGTPKYHTMRQDGPDHDRTFTVEVYIGERAYGLGMGKNKKDAEQSAAERTLSILAQDRNNSGGDGEPHG